MSRRRQITHPISFRAGRHRALLEELAERRGNVTDGIYWVLDLYSTSLRHLEHEDWERIQALERAFNRPFKTIFRQLLSKMERDHLGDAPDPDAP